MSTQHKPWLPQEERGRFWLLTSLRDLVDRIAQSSPARLALIVFAVVVAAFSFLLWLPVSSAPGVETELEDAVFTATSAVTVTGLTTVPTGTHWSFFGQFVIMIAMQIGGLGTLTMTSILALAVGRKLGLRSRLLTQEALNIGRLGEVGSLLRVVVLVSVSFELAIAVILIPRFAMLGESWGDAAWHGVFYAISAFNNAGFIPTEEGLNPFASDWWVLLPIIVGVFVGSLGFPALLNLLQLWRTPRRWSLHAKLTLSTSLALLVFGSLVVAAFEWTNERTFAPMDADATILASLFAGVMPRSGGFSTVDTGEMHEGTWLLLDALMFVGGGSASTAGGIRVTTMAVMLLAIVAEARGDRDVEAFGRRIPREALQVAIAVSLVSATIVLVASLAMLAVTGLTLDVILFEVISAFATVGLSTGLTADLPDAGKYVLALLMFVGRTGTMTLAAALALRSRRRVIRYPEERPIIG